ncbi:MAG: class III cytochrome C family protein [Lutibacter sp.]|nr:MAG: class III cytochrome C family protein [Lutibacter sp.]
MIMKKKTINYIIILSLSVLVVLTFFLPERMIRPGKLIDAHAEIETSCLACHTAFASTPPQKCTTCHTVEDIGINTTKGLSIATENKNVAFHQELTKGDCMSCHSDHKGVMAFRPISQFSHNLLDQNALNQCNKCHSNPSDNLHSKLTGNCIECHTVNTWKPSTFNHEEYFSNDRQSLRDQCSKCHSNPNDALHSNLTDNCIKCHSLNSWTPSTFEHTEYFRFDRNHKTECVSCHINKNYTKYTCYGCHEHSRSKIREEHIEEGISNYENCVECHRSGNEDEAKRIWRNHSNNKKDFKFNDHDDDDHD